MDWDLNAEAMLFFYISNDVLAVCFFCPHPLEPNAIITCYVRNDNVNRVFIQ